MRRPTVALPALGLVVAVVAAALAVPARPAEATEIRPHIIGGSIVDAATVPWTVAVLNKSRPNGFDAQFCGGSLIHEKWVLTAAHCVDTAAASNVDVAWGKTKLSQITASDRRPIRRIIVHPRWNPSANLNDVALLELTTAATGAETIPLHSDELSPALGDALATYGWGNTSATGTSYPDDLRGVSLQDRSGPSGACGNYGSGFVSEHMVCVGVPGGGKDACQGDSGGPLVKLTPSPVLVGVTSWGTGCALANFPGLWARVSSYVPWIEQQISPQPVRVSVGDVTVVEGDTKTRTANAIVTLSSPSNVSITVPYATVAGTARLATDFTAKTSSITFAPGQVSKALTVSVKGDTVDESMERFRVELGTPTGGAVLGKAVSIITVIDDDPNAGVLRLAVGDAQVVEGNDGRAVVVKVNVSLSRAATTTINVPFQTVAGTATAGYDFTAKSGSLAFKPGVVSRTVAITIKPEWLPERGVDESLTLVVGAVNGANTTRGVGTVTILADE